MTGYKHKDPQVQLMLNVWTKAFQDGEVRIPLGSKSDVTNIRFKLYNAARGVKKLEPGTDFDLEDAVNNCSIRTEDETTLVVYRKDKSSVLQAVAAAIGETVSIGADKAAIESEANAMLARMGMMQAKVAETVAEVKPSIENVPPRGDLLARYSRIREEG